MELIKIPNKRKIYICISYYTNVLIHARALTELCQLQVYIAQYITCHKELMLICNKSWKILNMYNIVKYYHSNTFIQCYFRTEFISSMLHVVRSVCWVYCLLSTTILMLCKSIICHKIVIIVINIMIII